MFMRSIGTVKLALGLAMLPIAPAVAEQSSQTTPVIELFTSQGCSSCPSADRLLKSYAERRDLVALSYSVDYWDYLGWKDTLASPKFTERQRAYSKTRGDGQIYTPQAIVNGVSHVVGSDRARIDQALERTSRPSTLASAPLKCWGEDDAVVIEIGDASAVAGQKPPNGTVWIAVVQPKAEVAVKHGENRGSALSYHNVVRELVPAGMYSGKATTIRLPRKALTGGPGERLAVLVQQGTSGPIIAATWMAASR